MRTSLSAFALLATLAAAPAWAQDTAGETPAEEPAAETPSAEPAEQTPDAAPTEGGSDIPLGEVVTPEGEAVGTPYIREEHGDWDIRCVRTVSGNDPCVMFQLLEQDDGNPVAEMTVSPLFPPEGEVVAGGEIITPLQTLLPAGVTITVDGGAGRRYPFRLCTERGCVAVTGYGEADVAAFKRGNAATVAIVPAQAPDQRIALTVSLTGFTAGYDALAAYYEELVAAGQENAEQPTEGDGQ